MIELWIILAIGVWSIIFSFIMGQTKNFRSVMIFKVVPFFQGLYLIWYTVVKHQLF